MKIWKQPRDEHVIYEALSAIADGRVELVGENKAKCTSTSKGKFYEIEVELESNSIMSNDNMAFYVEEFSYPMIALLILKDVYRYDKDILPHFKDIKWKDINQKNKNNYMKSVGEVLENLKVNGVDTENIKIEIDRIYKEILDSTWYHLGEKKVPPNAY